MQRMHPTVSFFFLLLLFALLPVVSVAVPADLETEALVAQATEANVSRIVSYQLTIDQEIVPGVPEIIGRTYSVAVMSETNGIFLNENGSVLADAGILDDGAFEQHALRRSESAILNDLARIEHIKKYGREAPAEELPAYARYFGAEIGTLETFYTRRSDALQLKKVAESLSVDADGQTVPATLVGQKGGILVLQAEGMHYPSLRFSGSENIQPGDSVYIVSRETPGKTPAETSVETPAGTDASATIQTAVVTDVHDGQVRIDRPLSSGDFILDLHDKPVGIALDANGTAELKSSEEIAHLLSNLSVPNEESPSTRLYREALNAYRNGNYTDANETFSELLDYYPYHPEARVYRQDAQALLEQNHSSADLLKTVSDSRIPYVVAGILVFLLSFILLDKLLLGKRR